MAMLQGWLQICCTRHDSCLAPLPKLPRRLVYVSNHNVRLIESEGLAYTKYTTLSHCWGSATNMIKTTKGNIKNRKSNIDRDELNQIFKDAIAITQRVGCQWIWIDSLCIIQDDIEDWIEESSKMADIYSNSFLNIAATSSMTNAGSCFCHRKFHYEDPTDTVQLRTRLVGQSVDILDEHDSPSMGLCVRVAHWLGHQHVAGSKEMLRCEASPLLDRAWVFQERLLAPRTLHFGSSEMLWECNSCLTCECTGISPSTQSVKAAFADACQDRASKDEILDLWQKLVEGYTSLSLTQWSDTPHAIAGIASRISTKLNSDYLAGIWEHDLPRGLLWEALCPGRMGNERRPSPETNQSIPTWSWMSLYHAAYPGAKAFYPYTGKFHQDDHLSVRWRPSVTGCTDVNPFSDVPSGQLEISAATTSGKLQYFDARQQRLLLVVDENSRGGIVHPDSPVEDALEDEMEVLCVLFGTTRSEDDEPQVVLILRPSKEEGCYTRIGIAQWILRSGFHDAEVKTIVVR
jgi:hypothetical protein